MGRVSQRHPRAAQLLPPPGCVMCTFILCWHRGHSPVLGLGSKRSPFRLGLN
ncbi:MAG TPA: hypothetical protein VN867_00700 [Candidatus Binataceae bacterium]|nr:hypothetical protein [Candidatus Binataceae bacterium]